MIYTAEQTFAATSLSRCTVYRLVKSGQFPKQIRLSAGRVGWRKSDIEAWLNEQAKKTVAAK